MRLPGTRYQEHGWELVRKLLGQCSLQACAPAFVARVAAAPAGDIDVAADCMDDYIGRTATALRASRRQPRAAADGNSYGETVLELALGLLFELQARPGDWHAFMAAVAAEAARLGPFWQQAGGEANLRKKFNDMYAVLRDKVDADSYAAACGRPCSANRMYAYRMLDTAYADIARLFDSAALLPEQVGAILGRPVSAAAVPIEVRQMKSIGACQPAWVLAWSASREAFTGAAGPLHTRSKRFAGLKNNPGAIGEMLREIGDYEELSANRSIDGDWQQDAIDANAWLDDLARVFAEPVADDDAADRVLAPPDDAEADANADANADADDDAVQRAADRAETPPLASAAEQLAAAQVSLPPSYLPMARLAEDSASWAARAMASASLPVRLAVYLKLMGARDDCFPAEWLDPATGELPNMQQLAALDGVSLPTLRKRRDRAIDALHEAALQAGTGASRIRSVSWQP